MTDASELFKYIPVALVVGFFVYGTIRSSEREKAYKEAETNKRSDAKKAKSDAVAAEIDVANRSASLLPDIESALNLLRESYGWREIASSINITGLQLEFLRELPESDALQVTLPNMQADHYNSMERHVVSVVNNFTSLSDDVPFYGIDSYAQEFTVKMLSDLVSAGYVSTTKPISKNKRTYTCALTQHGVALMGLDGQFCRGDTAKKHVPQTPCSQSLGIIGDVLRRSIELKISTRHVD